MTRLLKISPYLLVFAGFALRLYRLGVSSLWYDETVSLYLAQSDLAELIRHTAGDIHPPLYYLLLHFWGRLAGWSEFAMAFVSLWFGVLLISLIYRVSRDWLHHNMVAVLAALLLAVSPYNVWYSQEVRMYTFGAALGLLSVFFLRRLMTRSRIFSFDLVLYVIFTTLGLYTLYYFVFLILFEWLWVAFRASQIARGKQIAESRSPIPDHRSPDTDHRLLLTDHRSPDTDNRSLLTDHRSLLTDHRLLLTDHRSPITHYSPLLTFLLSQLALVLLYLPWLPTAYRQAADPPVPPWREFIPLPRVLLESFSALAFGQSVDPNVFGILALLIFIPILFLLWRQTNSAPDNPARAENNTRPGLGDARSATRDTPFAIRDPRFAIGDSPSAFFLLGYFLVPLAAIFLFSLWKPLYHVRYLFTYSPAFYILAAYAFVNLWYAFARPTREKLVNARRALGALAVLLSLAFFTVVGYSLYNFWYNPQYAKDDLRGAVNYIAEHWRPGDVILVNAGYTYPALMYYLPEPITRRVRLPSYEPLLTGTPTLATASRRPIVLMTGSIGGSPNLGWSDSRSDFFPTTADATRDALGRTLEGHARVWMLRLYDTVVDPDGVIRDYLDSHARLFDDQAFTGESQLRVQGFVKEQNASLPANATLTLKLLTDRVQLVGYEISSRTLRAGESLDVVLYWRPLQILNLNYQVTLQLLNPNGENVAQIDELPLGGELPMTRWRKNLSYREPLRLKLPSSLATGEYHAIVKMYDPRSGDVLGDVIDLGSIQIR